eukprot:m.240342 g.240342  ORF g.240342 m.240342 type:complete len:129 (-) comp18987_c1_seq4:117-503(-)
MQTLGTSLHVSFPVFLSVFCVLIALCHTRRWDIDATEDGDSTFQPYIEPSPKRSSLVLVPAPLPTDDAADAEQHPEQPTIADNWWDTTESDGVPSDYDVDADIGRVRRMSRKTSYMSVLGQPVPRSVW